MQQLQKTLTSPADAAGFLQGSRDSGGSSKDSSCDTDDFVMVPAQFPGRASAVWRQGQGGVADVSGGLCAWQQTYLHLPALGGSQWASGS